METIRIRTDVTNDGIDKVSVDKNIKIQLQQDFDYLEILSLKISQEDVYRRFCSDYGVIVGRVTVNSGSIGIPNAKVSVFIPISDEDKENEELRELYPYEVITDRNIDGIRYNLLPKRQQSDCHTPVGTFPDKREILDNEMLSEVHEKYFKYTTTTNNAGDFMLFGVPIGTHTIHVDCDISDIGIFSQKPYDFASKGVSQVRFDSPTKFKGGRNIDSLPQIKTANKGVNVIPFWGDTSNCELGISRIDIDLNYELTPSAFFMGSIFGDSEKNSINKRCRPRKNLGRLCETMTNTGTVEVLRKRNDGAIERADVDGGRVIDENGNWAFQVPMNLDNVITDEFGNLTPSPDPSKGLPTRADVRFRITMDQNGGEGRLRQRASFLVPNNPNSYADSDYNFDEETTDDSFYEMSWNKIYTVKNFIPRFQRRGGINNKNFIGIKNVDECTNSHTPFPYNRLNTNINALFSILCVFINIFTVIVTLINLVVITVINTVIQLLNGILTIICRAIQFFSIGATKKCENCSGTRVFGNSNCSPQDNASCSNGSCDFIECDCSDILNYIPCIGIPCGGDEGTQTYAPGCRCNSNGKEALETKIIEEPDTNLELPVICGINTNLADCLSIQLADALNAFTFEFYNDWVNGTLYAFLLKYKKKRKGKEKFCEFDCDDFSGGVDGNEDGNPDNNCKRSEIIDSCVSGGVVGLNAVNTQDNEPIRDGLIKKYKNNFYYASYTHNSDYKLFATDIVSLGAIFDCDWEGQPKIIDRFPETSYLLPPIVSELDEDDPNKVIVAGMDGDNALGFQTGLFFEISCLGFRTELKNCTNLKRICEIGVGLSEDREDEDPQIGCVPSLGIGGGQADTIIDNCDIDNLFIRDIFTQLNDPLVGVDLSDTSTPNLHSVYGVNTAYNRFRDFSNNVVKQPENSYYFYFGIRAGRTALDLFKNRFFSPCEFRREDPFFIIGEVNDISEFGLTDGSITLTITGGNSPFTFNWSGPNGFTSNNQDLINLSPGTYEVTVIDDIGQSVTTTFVVGQPFALSCNVQGTNPTTNGGSNGSILVSAISGGLAPYTVIAVNTISNVTYGPFLTSSSSQSINNLPSGNYVVTTTDSSVSTQTCQQTVNLTQPPLLIASVNSTNVTCGGFSDGTITISASGGVPPYTYNTVGGSYSSNLINQNNVPSGTFNVTVTDNNGQIVNNSVTITSPSVITANILTIPISCSTSNNGGIRVTPSGGSGSYSVTITNPNGVEETVSQSSNTFIVSNLSVDGIYGIVIEDSNGCTRSYTTTIYRPNQLTISLNGTLNVTNTGGSDGLISVSANGGTPASPISLGGYCFVLTGPVSTTNTSGTFSSLPAGNYSVRVVTKINSIGYPISGCAGTTGCFSNIINVTITQP